MTPLQIGVPVLNRGDLLRRLVSSVDVDADILIILNRIGPIDQATNENVSALEQCGLVRVDRIEGNLGVAGSWNRIMDSFDGD